MRSVEAMPAPGMSVAGWSESRVTGGQVQFWLAIVLLGCFYYTFPVVKTPFGYTTYLRFDDFASLFFVLVSLRGIFNRRKSIETQIFKLLMIAAVLLPISALVGILLYSDSFADQYSIWQLLQYYRIFLIFAAASTLELDLHRIRQLLFVAWCGSIFVSIYALMQYLGVISYRGLAEEFAESGPWGSILKQEYRGIVVGPLSHNYAVLGNYMAVAIIITFALVRMGGWTMKPLYQISIPCFVIISVLSKSRAGLSGIIVGLFAYLILSKARPAAIIGFALGLASIAAMISLTPQFQERFLISESGKTVTEFSSGRLTGWLEVMQIIASHPEIIITGCGLGHYKVLYFKGWTLLGSAHNNYLHILVESTIFGLILFIAFLVRLAQIFRFLSIAGSKAERELGTAMLSLLCALMFIALTQENFVPSSGMASTPAYLAFIFGIVIALSRHVAFRYEYDAAYHHWASLQGAQHTQERSSQGQGQ